LLPPSLLLPSSSAASVDYGAVRKAIADAMDSNPDYDGLGSYGPVLVRLAWHCAGTYDKATNTGGSDGATMRFEPESQHGANAGLGVARDLLEPIKKRFPGISYADLYTLAGAVAIEEMGGPVIPWTPGRRDAASGAACPPDGRLPAAHGDGSHIRQIFGRMGFDDREMVALIGAHALGKCHTDRSGYDGPWTRAPTTWSNEYFTLLKDPSGWRKRKWSGPVQYENKDRDLMMLPADMALLWDKGFKRFVDEFAADAEAFDAAFAKAFGKLLELGVKRDGAAAAGAA
jgi:cytochrome c peroxidase